MMRLFSRRQDNGSIFGKMCMYWVMPTVPRWVQDYRYLGTDVPYGCYAWVLT